MRPVLFAVLLLVLAVPAHAQITNGGFEPGSGGASSILPPGSTLIPGWVTIESGAEWFTPSSLGYNNSPQGGYVVDLANYTSSAGGVAQTFATVPGQAYQIDFYLGTHAVSGRNGTCQIVVDADGTSQTYVHSSLTGTIGWSARTFVFTADGPTATLRFRCLQNALLHFAYIDGVGAQLAVPAEAESWGAVKGLYRR